jgi:hypothetical protein
MIYSSQKERRIVVGLNKVFRNCYLRLLFKPYLAEHFRFLVTNGFLVVYLDPKFGLKLKRQILVSSYFSLFDEETTLNILEDLRERQVRIIQRSFKTTAEFIDFAQNDPILKENRWVKTYLENPEIVNYRSDFFLTSMES